MSKKHAAKIRKKNKIIFKKKDFRNKINGNFTPRKNQTCKNEEKA